MEIGSTEEMKITGNTIMIDGNSGKGEEGQVGFLYRLGKGCGTIQGRLISYGGVLYSFQQLLISRYS